MMPAQHRSARDLFVRAWKSRQKEALDDPTPHALQLAQAVAVVESSYASPAAWAKNTPKMASSHNYGAIQCKGPESPTCIGGVRDHTQAGAPFVGFYRAYATAEEGAADLIAHLSRKVTKPALMAGSVTNFVRAMYAEGYFTGICREALKADPKAAAESSSTRRSKGLGPAETSAGQACDEEVVTKYAKDLKRYADEVAAAMGEEPIPLDDDLNLWPVLALLAVVAVGGVGYYVWSEYLRDEDPAPRRVPIRRNASRAEWRQLYRSTCGPDREARRLGAGERATERRAEVEDLIKRDRGEARRAGRVETKAAREKEAARARAEARKAELKAELTEIRAEADRPCSDAKTAIVLRTTSERRAASERRTPKQREAGRLTLIRLSEEIEREAGEVENVIGDRHGSNVGKDARRWFMGAAGRHYVAAAKRSRARGWSTTAAELGTEAYEENLSNRLAELHGGELEEPEEESEEEYLERTTTRRAS